MTVDVQKATLLVWTGITSDEVRCVFFGDHGDSSFKIYYIFLTQTLTRKQISNDHGPLHVGIACQRLRAYNHLSCSMLVRLMILSMSA